MNTRRSIFIAFASPKGGVGKSTSCLCVAGALAKQGHTVHVVDFDQTQTLYRWYTSNDIANTIPNIKVERGPIENLKDYLHHMLALEADYVLIDLAGTFTDYMLHLAVFADMTITPAKLSEPDILEAAKLDQQLKSLAARIGKPIAHRILINEVPPLILAGYQRHALDQLDHSQLSRFATLIHYRAAYPEAFLTGLPPHYADASRATVAKAVEEIDHVVGEIHAAFEDQQQKAAA